MAAVSNRGAMHRRTGAALGYAGDVEEVHMRCTACGTLQTETMASDEPLRSQMQSVVCLFCARFGTMARAPKVLR